MIPGSDVRVLLINMPFAGVTHPSLALGLFKAQLRAAGIECDVADLNLRFAQRVGWDNYSAVQVSSAVLAGEQMFADELFAGYIPAYQQYDADILPLVDGHTRAKLHHMKANVAPFLDDCVESVAWERYDIIGFSTVFEQNLPSLALAHRIKRRHGDKLIVFGGANCEDVMGEALHRCFPFVDIVCTGEANVTFPELVDRLRFGHPIEDLPGIVYRAGVESISTGPPEKVQDLDSLPFPDYDDYFRTHARTGATFTPAVSIETARGCWWGEKVMCTFCGLNGQSIAFRAKSADRALEEFIYLTSRYPTNFVRAVDNMMPPSYYEDLLPRLAEVNPGVDVFYEVRPDLGRREVKLLADARVTTVQAGVENLSSHVLRLMHKGTTALKNIEFLRRCREAGIDVDWNMLFGFPGEQREDYGRAADLASVITHLKAPSSLGEIRLDRFSPNFERASEIGFTNVRPWSLFRYVYPFDEDTLMDLVYHFDYDNDAAVDSSGIFQALHEHIFRWQRCDDALFAVRDNGHLTIRDTRPVAPSPEVRLEGMEAAVYEYCDTRRNKAQVHAWLEQSRAADVERGEVERLLDDLVARKLMVEENGVYLSLALFGGPAVPGGAAIPAHAFAC